MHVLLHFFLQKDQVVSRKLQNWIQMKRHALKTYMPVVHVNDEINQINLHNIAKDVFNLDYNVFNGHCCQ